MKSDTEMDHFPQQQQNNHNALKVLSPQKHDHQQQQLSNKTIATATLNNNDYSYSSSNTTSISSTQSSPSKTKKEKSKRKSGNHHSTSELDELVLTRTTDVSSVRTTTTTTAVKNSTVVTSIPSGAKVVIPSLDLEQIVTEKKKKKKKQLAPIITNMKNNHHQQLQTAVIMSSDNINLREESASPVLAVQTSKSHVNNNNNTPMMKNTFNHVIEQTSAVARSGSVSSGLDNEDAMNEQQYESPASTPRMFSPSSTLNFNAMSPREFPLDSPHQLPGQQKQPMPHIEMLPVVMAQPSNEVIHQHNISEHESAVDLSSVETHETHDSEHTTIHSSSKTVALSTSSSVNNSSPAVGNEEKRHSTRSRSNSTKSSQFNRPLERAHTAPNIVTKKQPEKHHSKSSSRLSSKYGQSEYKTYVKHTLKLKEAGDMRVRGISLKYETNYHEFLEEAIPHKTFVTEMNLLNQFLKSNEPGTKYCCLGFTFFCCTLGLSMLPFAYQLSHFETAVRKYLDELNKKYASVHVSWKLVPCTTPSDDSYVVVSLEKEIDPKDLEKLEIS